MFGILLPKKEDPVRPHHFAIERNALKRPFGEEADRGWIGLFRAPVRVAAAARLGRAVFGPRGAWRGRPTAQPAANRAG